MSISILEQLLNGDPKLTATYIVAVSVVLLLLKQIMNMKRIRGVPSVKGGLPFVGQAFVMMKGSPWDTMDQWARDYGSVYKFHLFGSDALAVSDPEVLRVVLHSNVNDFKKDTEWTYQPFLDILGTGMVTSYGQEWLRQRVLLAKHFKTNVLESIPQLSANAFNRFSAKLQQAKKTGAIVEMAEEFRHLTLQVIAEAILSLNHEESDRTFAKMYLPIVEEGHLRTWNPVRAFIPSPAWFQYNKDVKSLNDYVVSLIETRWSIKQKEKASGAPISRRYDVMDKILDAVEPNNWNKATLNSIRDSVKTFILAGHETSASMLAWTLYELTEHPEMMARVKKEAMEVFEGHWDPVTKTIKDLPPFEKFSKLVYAECCLREALRKYSNVPTVVRVAMKDVNAGKVVIPKGMTVMINMQGAHHDPENWPEPLKYDPNRFLTPLEPLQFKFIPFIAGPRECIGQFLALLETKIILSLLTISFDFEVTNPQDAGLKHQFMIPIIPKTGHFMKIH